MTNKCNIFSVYIKKINILKLLQNVLGSYVKLLHLSFLKYTISKYGILYVL